MAQHNFHFDDTGALLTTGGGSGGGTVNQGLPGTVPNSWYVTVTGGGNIALVTVANRLSVDASGVTLTTEDLATGIIGSPVLADAIQVGYKDGSGNLQIPSASKSLPCHHIVSGGGSPDVNLIKVGGSPITIGQAVMAASLPVVIASNQSSLPVTVGNFPATVAVTQSTNPWITNIQASGVPLTATLAGSPAVEALNVFVTNATSSSVTQGTSPWVVSGTVTANQGGAWTVAATQSGTWTVQQGGAPWSVSQSGSWTVAATQSGVWSTRTQDGSGNPISSTSEGSPATTGLNVHIQEHRSGFRNIVTVSQGTSPWVTSFSAPQHVIVDSATLGTVSTKPAAPSTAVWTQASISFSSSGDNTVVAGSGSTTIRIMRLSFVNSDTTTATSITIKDSTPTSFSGAFRLVSGGSFGGDSEGEPLYVTASGKGFVINSSAAVQISGTVWYTQS